MKQLNNLQVQYVNLIILLWFDRPVHISNWNRSNGYNEWKKEKNSIKAHNVDVESNTKINEEKRGRKTTTHKKHNKERDKIIIEVTMLLRAECNDATYKKNMLKMVVQTQIERNANQKRNCNCGKGFFVCTMREKKN